MLSTAVRSIATRRIIVGIACLLLGGCSGSTAAPREPGSSSPSPTPSVQEVDVGGYRLVIECEGEGSPTILFDAGAGNNRSTFAELVEELRETTKVCAYDRAGIGESDFRPTAEHTTLGDLADELARLLEGAGLDDPVVLASHSLGGGIAQFFVDRHPDHVAGLVFIDPTAIPRFVDWFGPEVDDGPVATIDMRRTFREWERLGSWGSIPLFVLTQNFQGDDDDFLPPRFRRYFRGVHEELATRSSDAVHVIAVDSGHFIYQTSPDLVTAAIIEIVEAARSGDGLAPCDDRFEDLGGACA
jgi:pimeloyl-ACP methyl ester carboxylesterase